MSERVLVLGLGHVGLPLAAVMASAHEVFGVDPRGDDVLAGAALEPGLPEAAGRVVRAAPDGPVDVAVVAVPTPLGPDGADLGAVRAAVDEAVSRLSPSGLLLLVSTCPVGTARGLAVPPGIAVATSPERGMPGRMLAEISSGPRLVGGVDAAATERARAFVATWCAEPLPVTAEEAELAKLVENASRDLSLAFVNQVATAAEALGLDGARICALASTHPRVSLLRPGIGVGGHCLPVDPHFLPASITLSRAAREANEARTEAMVARIRAFAGGRSVGLLGLSYKPDTADVRHAPALSIARSLGCLVHDPHVRPLDVRWAPLEAILACDVVVRLVAHAAFAHVPVHLDLS